MRAPLRQCADAVFMVRPAAFGFNPETAASNAFQRQETVPAEPTRARAESDAVRVALESEGVRVVALEDSPTPYKPDALFPNNWVSFHGDGTVVLYPMLGVTRRLERRHELLEEVCARLHYRLRRRIDLTEHEGHGRFLEGTGSLVLDHVARVAYACRSTRTDESLVREWARLMDFETVIFDAVDSEGRPYYHTNVMMWIGTRCALICAAAVADRDRERVLATLRASGRELIEVSREAVSAYAGNMLELGTWDEALGDASVLIMSATAKAALSAQVFRQLSGCVDAVLAVAVPTIETVGGGSVRCLLAEVPETAG